LPQFHRKGKDLAIWKNKHVLIAGMTAPILGLLAYFTMGHFIGEKPHVALEGQSYLLVEKPKCRYDSGQCGLKNGNFELQLSFEKRENNQLLLKLHSVNPLDGVMLAMVESEDDPNTPVPMGAMGDDGLIWALDIPIPDPDRHRLHLVASSKGSLYYGDVSTKFTLK
jgi:hypothetical protein